MPSLDISVVIPVFNEEECLDELHRRLHDSLERIGRSYELIFVDDGSTDRSLELLTAIWGRDAAHVQLFSFTKNFGQHIALTAGLDAAKGDLVVIMDSDLQDQPEELHILLDKLDEGYDVVWGDRQHRQHTWYKRLGSRAFIYALNRVAKTEIPFNSTIYRVMRRPVADDLRRLRERARFLPGLVSWVGYRQTSAPVEHGKRFAGTTKYPLWRLIRLALHTATSFSAAPLQFATIGGILAAIAALCFLIYIVARKLLCGYAVLGYASTMFAILFFGALQLLVLGMMGEYISRIYSESQNRPLYLLRDLSLREILPQGQSPTHSISTRPDIARLDELSAGERAELAGHLAHDRFIQLQHVPIGCTPTELADYYFDQWRDANPWVIRTQRGGELQGMAILQALPWDTRLLGLPAGRLHYVNAFAPRFSPERLIEIDSLLSATRDFMASQKLRLVDARVSSKDYFTARAFEANGFHLVDTLVTLGAGPEKRDRILEAHLPLSQITREGIRMNSSLLIRPMIESDIETLAKLSHSAFGEVEMIQDRFFLEPMIEHDRAQNLFQEWFMNIARRQSTGEGLVVVAELDGVPAGYVAMDAMRHPAMRGWWKDGLNAVDPSVRSMGAYRAMIVASLHFVREAGGTGLMTKTQISTSRVLNSWLHLGADIYESFATMHWTDQG